MQRGVSCCSVGAHVTRPWGSVSPMSRLLVWPSPASGVCASPSMCSHGLGIVPSLILPRSCRCFTGAGHLQGAVADRSLSGPHADAADPHSGQHHAGPCGQDPRWALRGKGVWVCVCVPGAAPSLGGVIFLSLRDPSLLSCPPCSLLSPHYFPSRVFGPRRWVTKRMLPLQDPKV